MTGAVPAAVYVVLAALIGAGGVALIGWAMVWDRARGRRRCPRCWYDMSGVPGLACPECGRRARRERSLRRTRRRWWWAAAGLLLVMLAYPAGVWPRIARDGWLAPLPDRAVVELLPITGMDGVLGRELYRRLGVSPAGARLGGAQLSEDGLILLLRRIRWGNLLARPYDSRWRESYGRFARRPVVQLYRAESVAGPAWSIVNPSPSQALADAVAEWESLPPLLSVRTRDRWVRGAPVVIEASAETWWPDWLQWEPRIIFCDGGWESIPWDQSVFCALSPQWDGTGGAVVVEVAVIRLDRTLSEGNRGLPRGEALRERHRLTFEAVDSVDDLLAPVRSPELDELLTDRLVVEFGHLLLLNPVHLAGRGVDDVIFAGVADIMHEDEVKASFRFWWHGGGAPGGGRGPSLSAVTDDVHEFHRQLAVIRSRLSEPGWHLRLTSEPHEALLWPEGKRYWVGQVVLPLAR